MNLFVYGTLLVPEIWRAVTGSDHGRWAEGTLRGHRIRRVRGADFPAITPTALPGETVPGRVAFEVHPADLARLDAYEDAFYLRQEVLIETADGIVAAEAYVVPPEHAAALLDEVGWTLEWFEQEALPSYLKHLSSS